MHYSVDIGHKFEKIRKLKGFSQDYIACKLNISQNSYSKIERGETRVTVKKIDAICEVLEIDVNVLQNFNPLQDLKQFTEMEDAPAPASEIFNSLEKVAQLYEALLTEKDARIRQLENVVDMLKK